MQTQQQKQTTYGLASKTNDSGKRHVRKNSKKANPFGVQSTNSVTSADTENVFAATSGK